MLLSHSFNHYRRHIITVVDSVVTQHALKLKKPITVLSDNRLNNLNGVPISQIYVGATLALKRYKWQAKVVSASMLFVHVCTSDRPDRAVEGHTCSFVVF